MDFISATSESEKRSFTHQHMRRSRSRRAYSCLGDDFRLGLFHCWSSGCSWLLHLLILFAFISPSTSLLVPLEHLICHHLILQLLFIGFPPITLEDVSDRRLVAELKSMPDLFVSKDRSGFLEISCHLR